MTDEKKIPEDLFDSMAEATEAAPDSELALVVETTSLARFEQKPTFDAEDIMIPRIKLTQALTQEVSDELVKIGCYYTPGYPGLEAINVIPMLFTRRRMYANNDTNEILCRSNDGVDGVGIPGGKCADCPMNHWTGEEGGSNRKPPACTFMYSYIVYVIDWEIVGVVDFKRTSLNAGKIVNSLTQRRGLGTFGVRLSSTKQTNKNKQAYYQMSVVPVEVTEEDLSTASQVMETGY
jgi:hypothetical protein